MERRFAEVFGAGNSFFFAYARWLSLFSLAALLEFSQAATLGLLLLFGASRIWALHEFAEREQKSASARLSAVLFLETLWVACLPHLLILLYLEYVSEGGGFVLAEMSLGFLCALALLVSLLGFSFNDAWLQNSTYFGIPLSLGACLLAMFMANLENPFGSEVLAVLHTSALGAVALLAGRLEKQNVRPLLSGSYGLAVAATLLVFPYGIHFSIGLWLLHEVLNRRGWLLSLNMTPRDFWFGLFLLAATIFSTLGVLGLEARPWLAAPLFMLKFPAAPFFEFLSISVLGAGVTQISHVHPGVVWLLFWAVGGFLVLALHLKDMRLPSFGKAFVVILCLVWYWQNFPASLLSTPLKKIQPVWVEGEQGSFEVLSRSRVLSQSRNLSDVLPPQYWSGRWILWHAQPPMRSERYVTTGLKPDIGPSYPLKQDFPTHWNDRLAHQFMREYPKHHFLIQVHEAIGVQSIESFLRAASAKSRSGFLFLVKPRARKQGSLRLTHQFARLFPQSKVYALEDGLLFSTGFSPQPRQVGPLNWRPYLSAQDVLKLWQRSSILSYPKMRQAILYHSAKNKLESTEAKPRELLKAALLAYEEGHSALCAYLLSRISEDLAEVELLQKLLVKDVRQLFWFQKACQQNQWPKGAARNILETGLAVQNQVLSCPSLLNKENEQTLENRWVRMEVLMASNRMTEAWDLVTRLPGFPRRPYARRILASLMERLGRFREAAVLQ